MAKTETVQEYAELPIDDVRPHPDNPRQGDIGAIVTMIREDGWHGTIVVQKSTGYILAGNHRWRAARLVGMTTIPCDRSPLTTAITTAAATSKTITTPRTKAVRGEASRRRTLTS